jgi:hypothetical protein
VSGTIALSYDASGNATLRCVPLGPPPPDLMTDVHNCSSVGHDVTGLLAHATTICVGGQPAIGSCDPGYYNLDGITSTGCESTPDQYEPNDTRAAEVAVAFPQGPIGSVVQVSANIAPRGDIDWYTVQTSTLGGTFCRGVGVFLGGAFQKVVLDAYPHGSSAPFVQGSIFGFQTQPTGSVNGVCPAYDFAVYSIGGTAAYDFNVQSQ